MPDILTQPTQDQIDAITQLEETGWRLERGPFEHFDGDVRIEMSWTGGATVAIHEYTITNDGRVHCISGWLKKSTNPQED